MNHTQGPSFQRKIYSKSMKKLMGMSDPISAETTRYLQRSRMGSKKRILDFPAFVPDKTANRTAFHQMKRQKTEKSPEEKEPERRGEQLLSTNNTSTTRLSPLLITQSCMAREVDNIMNEVIASHSPKLTSNPAIKHSISTKKFRNIRIKTQGNGPPAAIGMRTSLLIKEILSFMMKHSQGNSGHSRALREDPEIYNQDLSRFSPLKLIKKSEEVLGLYPHHEFKRQQELYLNKPLDSQTYIRQLRSGKTYIKDLQLKRH